MRNGFMTYDRQTIDSAGVFLIGELERLDQTMHEPLVSVMWGRDIDLREDVSIADEVSSFTLSNFASSGGIQTTGKSWIGKDTDQITGMSLDIGKTAHNLYLWGNELAYTIPELESSQRLGRPVDAQKYAALQLKHNMDIDEMVYTGDTLLGFPGLTNNDGVNGIVTNVAPVADTGTGEGKCQQPRSNIHDGDVKDRHDELLLFGGGEQDRGGCEHDHGGRAMNAEGGGFLPARAKHGRRITQRDEGRHGQKFAQETRRTIRH